MKNHDLSAGLVKLDYDTTLKALTIAVGYSLNDVRHYANEIDHQLEKDEGSVSIVSSELLGVAARKLDIAIETYVAWKGMMTRDKLIVTGLTADIVANTKGKA